MRSGEDYLAAIKRDGRTIYLDGERIEDVTDHRGFMGPTRTIASLYDRANDPSNIDALTYQDPATNERHDAMWLLPRSRDDIGVRRRVHRFWAEGSYGLMGRTPDHVACFITAFAGSRELFAGQGQQFGDNVVRFYNQARAENLFLAYTIVPPQIDRSKPAHQQPEPFLYPGVVKERDDGIVVRGAQMIGTSAVLADYLFLSYIVPLQPGDEDYAISVVMPMNTPGLKIYPRRPYATIATDVYDYPLSSRFDETDSLIVFDDVFIPWEHVFIYKDVKLVNAQFFETGAHLLGNFQALVRFVVKMQFAAGLARRLVEMHNLGNVPPVQGQLGGDIAAFCAALEAIVIAAETQAEESGGVVRPHPQFVYSGMSLQRRWVVDLMRALRELGGGGFISVPSSQKDFTSSETSADAHRYYQSAGVSAEDRVKVLKLMWDLTGTEFGGRQLQYEMFYSAAQHVVDMRVFRSFDWALANSLVEDCLAGYEMDGVETPAGSVTG